MTYLPGNNVFQGEAGELYEKIVREVADAIVAVDEGGIIRLCNPAAERLFGWPPGQLIGRPLDVLLPEGVRAGHVNHLKNFAAGNEETRNMGQRYGTVRGLRADGTEIDVWSTILKTKTNAGTMLVAVIRDITEALTQRRELQHLADTDYLTGVLNRRAFLRHAKQSQALALCSMSCFSVAIFDIDNFKRINDTFGHAAGDNVLIAFANILGSNMRNREVIARWGGEEFIVLFADTDLEAAKVVAERTCEDVRKFRFLIDSQPTDITINVTVSCGVTCSSFDASSLQNLINQADISLYAAKTRGKNRVVAYQEIHHSPSKILPG